MIGLKLRYVAVLLMMWCEQLISLDSPRWQAVMSERVNDEKYNKDLYMQYSCVNFC